MQRITHKKTYLAGGMLYFLARSIRTRSPTCRYISTRVVSASSRTCNKIVGAKVHDNDRQRASEHLILTGAVGSPNNFTMYGTNFDSDNAWPPCL